MERTNDINNFWGGIEVNKEEKTGKEPSLTVLMIRAKEIIERLEDDLEMDYKDYEKQPAEVGGEAFLSERESEINDAKLLYKLMKNELVALKEKRLAEVNKKLMDVLESEKSSDEEKNKAIENYLSETDTLISDEDHSNAQKIVSNPSLLKGNFSGLASLFRRLEPSVEVSEKRLKRVISNNSDETQKTKDTIKNIMIIHDGLAKTIDITDYGYNTITDSCAAIEVLIGMLTAKIAVYKQKMEMRKMI